MMSSCLETLICLENVPGKIRQLLKSGIEFLYSKRRGNKLKKDLELLKEYQNDIDMPQLDRLLKEKDI